MSLKLSKSLRKTKSFKSVGSQNLNFSILKKIKEVQKLEPLFHLPEEKFNKYIKNKSFIISLIDALPKELSFIFNIMDASLKTDEVFLLMLVKKYPQIIIFINPTPKFLLSSIKVNKKAVDYIPKNILNTMKIPSNITNNVTWNVNKN